MSIYPYISYFDGTEKYTDGSSVRQGYYVWTIEKNGNYITLLAEWLKNINIKKVKILKHIEP